MPHLSPMSWIFMIITSWTIMMLFNSNIWWSNKHYFETNSNKNMKKDKLLWQWFLQGGW
uniref:ATPase 8 n=1 Tax=Terrisswalkerius carbinensis TaxID=169909 RepID=Q94VP7_9ANNE|nr:ATPase 8 [Terrisswalkerius carbinensis]